MADDLARIKALAENDPEQFRRLMASLNKIVLRPHPGQQTVLKSKARFKVMNCGRRWGKTKLAAYMFTKRARQRNQMLWWVAPTYKVVKRGYAEVLAQLPPGVLEHDAPPETNFDAGRAVTLRFKNGTRMEFYSAERPEGMLGAGVDFCVMDESALMKPNIWHQIVGPTLMDREGGALMISTPRGRNWFYRNWQLGQDTEEPLWDSWTFPSASNPHLPPGEVERARKTTPRMEFEQEYEAKFLAAGSSVFLLEDFAIEHRAVLDNYMIEGRESLSGPAFLGIDLARTNDYTVLYGTDEKTRGNIYYERMQAIAWAEQRRRIRRATSRLLRAGAEHVTLMVDEGNAGSVIVEDLEEAGYDVIGVNFTTHKANMVRLLANDLERKRAFILNEGIEEFENYAMDTTPGGRMTYSAPEGQHDDIVSAKMLSHWGCVNEGTASVSILSPTGSPELEDALSDDIEDDDEAGWGDLIDEEPEMSDDEAAAAIGLGSTRRPTPEELLSHPALWF